ncbi:unnamed protein product [Pedinophyceae sp. YPF-701]|nr:unnamed protein product [Pedinophyceae sp. YPF-701]
MALRAVRRLAGGRQFAPILESVAQRFSGSSGSYAASCCNLRTVHNSPAAASPVLPTLNPVTAAHARYTSTQAHHESDDEGAPSEPHRVETQQTVMPHPSSSSTSAALMRGEDGDAPYNWFFQPVYSREYVESVTPSHRPPKTLHEKAALLMVTASRTVFDKVTGYGPNMTEEKWLRRMIFLETVAGVPGMIGGMVRHLRSLRLMKRDRGWIHTLLEEAENERMHLLTFLRLRKPGRLFRANVVLAQGLMCNAYFLLYLMSPKYCHAFVGYLEEEAVKTYTHALHDIDAGRLPGWTEPGSAPEVARAYWKLPEDASMRDVILNVRADELCHSTVNFTLSEVPACAPNPFKAGSKGVA